MSKLHNRYNKNQCISDSMWTRNTWLDKSSDIFQCVPFVQRSLPKERLTPDALQHSLSQISHHEGEPPSHT